MTINEVVQLLEAEKAKLDGAIAALKSLSGTGTQQSTAKRTMSPAARARIGRAARLRWKKLRAQKKKGN